MSRSTSRLSRRAFVTSSLAAAVAAAHGRAAFALPEAATTPTGTSTFRSRPDLVPPSVAVRRRTGRSADGYVFVAPFVGKKNGTLMIVDDLGEPVWIHQNPLLLMNFKVQRLAGKPVLTWWEGRVVNGFFEGECVIADTSYRVLKVIESTAGFQPEVHEFLITERGTALLSANAFVSMDLTPYGGSAQGTVLDGVVQEIDITSGQLLYEWHSLDHVGLDETSVGVADVWDYFHLNSIDVDDDGNLLVSARYPSAVYKIDRKTGAVIWRLGGTKSDFELGPGAGFWFQHDARNRGGGLLSIFDDGADAPDNAPEPVSRAILLRLDTSALQASLVKEFANPTGAVSVAMGSAQELYTGGYFVGWGTVPQMTEFAADGTVVFDAALPPGYFSYRAFRSQWPGRAPGSPAAATVRNANGSIDVYVSWNGATRVAQWQVVGGATETSMQPLKMEPRTGFETRIRISRPPAHLAVHALDAKGRTLGTSETVTT